MKKTVHVLLCMIWLVLCTALPAFGAESAPHVTAETTMAQLRANPAIQGTGYYTYCREMTPLMVERWKNKTLHDYFGNTDRESGIAALNLIIDNYNKGVKVTYQVYTPEEIEQNSSLGCVQLFYYPAETPGAKTAIVIPGNALTITSEMGEGGSTAYELHKRGYAVFVLLCFLRLRLFRLCFFLLRFLLLWHICTALCRFRFLFLPRLACRLGFRRFPCLLIPLFLPCLFRRFLFGLLFFGIPVFCLIRSRDFLILRHIRFLSVCCCFSRFRLHIRQDIVLIAASGSKHDSYG